MASVLGVVVGCAVVVWASVGFGGVEEVVEVVEVEVGRKLVEEVEERPAVDGVGEVKTTG